MRCCVTGEEIARCHDVAGRHGKRVQSPAATFHSGEALHVTEKGVHGLGTPADLDVDRFLIERLGHGSRNDMKHDTFP
jgi:hypothetical protein